jgi:hypothetical protein
MSVESLLEQANFGLQDCIEFLIELSINKKSSLKEVLDMPFNELPKHINDSNDIKKEMVLARLRKEDIKKNYNFVCQSLWNTEFDMDEYRQLGDNDGRLSVIAMIFRELGHEEQEKEALNWVYSD